MNPKQKTTLSELALSADEGKSAFRFYFPFADISSITVNKKYKDRCFFPSADLFID
jgi:hypothetical protein